MKILHILTAPRAEGTPRIVLDWLNHQNAGLTQEIMFIHPEGELSQIYGARTEWQYYNQAFRLKAVNFPKVILLVRKIVRQRSPDIVICWNTGISPWVAIGAKLGGKVKIITHAGNFPGHKWSFHTILHTNIAAYAHLLTKSQIICCSKYIKNSYQQVPFTPRGIFKAVYNCISIANFQSELKWNERKTDAIMVATLERHKDHLTLLDAWKILENKGLNYKLLIVGDGSQRTIIEDYASNQGLNNVIFLGSRNDVTTLLSNSKLFIFSTTNEEGFGTVLIEALASGCCIIASDVPACREILDNGKYGILVNKKSASDFAKNIEHKLSDTQPTKHIFSEHIDKFTVQEMIINYIKIANLD